MTNTATTANTADGRTELSRKSVARFAAYLIGTIEDRLGPIRVTCEVQPATRYTDSDVIADGAQVQVHCGPVAGGYDTDVIAWFAVIAGWHDLHGFEIVVETYDTRWTVDADTRSDHEALIGELVRRAENVWDDYLFSVGV